MVKSFYISFKKLFLAVFRGIINFSIAALRITGNAFKQKLNKVRVLKLAPGFNKFGGFKLEILILVIVATSAGMAQAQSFTKALVSNENSSDGFKILNKQSHLNRKFLEMASLSEYNDLSLPKIISLASASPELVWAAEAETSEDESKKIQSSFITTADDSTVVKPSYAAPPGPSSDGNIGVYVVAAGETISEIASRYAVSSEAILIANNINETAYIKPGQQLRIPSVNGLVYAPTAKDTFESLLEKFAIKEEEIDNLLNSNEVESSDDLLALEQIVIPRQDLSLPKELQKPVLAITSNQRGRLALSTAQTPSDFAGGSGNLLWPTTVKVITQKFSSRHLGIDVSGQRQNPGPSVFAADDCFVEIAGWQQGGWGNTIVCSHGNGLKTRYAHLATINVDAGQTVSRGTILGQIGSTGRSTGPHLHFTVYKNGVAVNPLSYVSP